MFNKILAGFLLGLCLVSFSGTGFSEDKEFVGNKRTKKYHYASCHLAQKIKPENLIDLKSPQEALEAGYVPCKVCKPADGEKK